jgi:zinc transport system ATP-binding protein
MKLIEVKNLKFAYKNEYVLKDVNFSVNEGDFLAIVGENGSGKSTLIKLLLGNLKKDQGQIKLFGKTIENFEDYQKIGYVPQVNDSNKISFPVTCREYIIMNLYKEFGFFKRPGKKQEEKVDVVLKTLNILELKNRIFKELSGGQQQKIMIARALVNDPEVLILDEPTVGIDNDSKMEFLKTLHHLNSKHKKTILMITHEMNLVKDYVTKRIKIEDGRILDV